MTSQINWASVVEQRDKHNWATLADAERQIVIAEAADHVVHRWTRGKDGTAPGAFHNALLDAIEGASPDNQDRLIAAFPEHVVAWGLAKHQGVRGRVLLRKIANTPEEPAGESA